VWPFLRGTGVVRRAQVSEKINSAGTVSETAAKCWPFMSNEVLSDFIALYAMDFKNLGYRTTAFSEDSAAAAGAAAAALGVAPGAPERAAEDGSGGVGGVGVGGLGGEAVTVTTTTKDGEPVATLHTNPGSQPISEERKAEARSALFNVDISMVDLDELRGGIADDVGGLGGDEAAAEAEAEAAEAGAAAGAESAAAAGAGAAGAEVDAAAVEAAAGVEAAEVKAAEVEVEVGAAGAAAVAGSAVAAEGQTEEHGGRTTPGCVGSGDVLSLGAGEDAPWTPPSWAVVEGVLRRAVFKCQTLTDKIKSSVRDAGASLAGIGASEAAVGAALKSAVDARDLGEAAARNPLGKGGHKAFAAAAKAGKAAAKLVKAASAALNLENAPQAVRDAFARHAAEAAAVGDALAEAVGIRRAREEELFDHEYAKQKEEHAAALSGYLR
jgi:hypothetical protein